MNRAEVVQTFVFNGVACVEYRCPEIGDGLALHSHAFNHLTLCLEGEIEAFLDDGRAFPLKPGEPPLEYIAGRKHGIRGTTPGARFLNLSPLPGYRAEKA